MDDRVCRQLFCSTRSIRLAASRRIPLAGGVSSSAIPRAACFQIEAVLLIFLFGACALSAWRPGDVQEVLPSVSISSAALLFVALPLQLSGATQ
jgi:hypothetical protein